MTEFTPVHRRCGHSHPDNNIDSNLNNFKSADGDDLTFLVSTLLKLLWVHPYNKAAICCNASQDSGAGSFAGGGASLWSGGFFICQVHVVMS